MVGRSSKSMGSRSSRRRLIRRGLVTIAATAMVTAGSASPAQAWTDSSDVDLFGFASCKTVPYAMDIMPDMAWVYVESTGETAESAVNYWSAYWSVHLHTIPNAGSPVQIFIHCDVPGVGPQWRFVRTTVVKRPWLGQAVQMQWAKA